MLLATIKATNSFSQEKQQQKKEKEYNIKLTINDAKSLIYVLNKSNESHAVIMDLITKVSNQFEEQLKKEQEEKSKSDSTSIQKKK